MLPKTAKRSSSLAVTNISEDEPDKLFSLLPLIAFKMVKTRSMDDENKKNIVGFFSLEMSSEQLATRILAEDSSISSEKIRRGQLNSNDFQKIVKSSQTLGDLSLYIDDSPNLSISALRKINPNIIKL